MKLSFYNEWHLGDCALHLYYLRGLADIGYDSDFYVHPQYLAELQDHIVGYEDRISLIDIAHKTNARGSWIGEIYFIPAFESWDYNNFYLRWFNYLSALLHLPQPVQSMICDYAEISKRVPDKQWDVLLINSEGLSNGFGYNTEEFSRLNAFLLDKGLSVLTTQKIDSYECSRDYNWGLVDIGAAAIKSKYVIAQHTSPIHLSINKWSIGQIEKWFILHRRDTFTFNEKFERIGNYQEFNKIYQYFEENL